MPPYEKWIVAILSSRGGSATLLEVSREVWQRHEAELRHSGDEFYRWQYSLRWAAQNLRDKGVLQPVGNRRNQPWQLSNGWQPLMDPDASE